MSCHGSETTFGAPHSSISILALGLNREFCPTDRLIDSPARYALVPGLGLMDTVGVVAAATTFVLKQAPRRSPRGPGLGHTDPLDAHVEQPGLHHEPLGFADAAGMTVNGAENTFGAEKLF